jgi:hypothetical protein
MRVPNPAAKTNAALGFTVPSPFFLVLLFG